jgi:hypothetical protein
MKENLELLALIKRDTNHDLTNDDFNLSLTDFIYRIYPYAPGQRGIYFQQYLIFNNNLYSVSPKDQKGDCSILNKKFAEIKVSFLGKSKSFNIKNITTESIYDWFFLCFIDPHDNFKPKFFCIDKENILNNPLLKTSNMHKNTKNLLSITIKSIDLHWVLDKHNLLKGTKYSDFQKFITEQINTSDSLFKPYTTKNEKSTITNKKTKSVVSFIVDKQTIIGKNNRDTVTKLVKHLGPKKLDGVIWNSQFKKVQTKDCDTPVGYGYYLNPKFSLRDIKNLVNQIRLRTEYNVFLNIK